MKIRFNLLLLIAVMLSTPYGSAKENDDIHFYPVKEIFVDELPESVMDFEYTSQLPVVYRGAATHWEAMNWTPESLEERGLSGIKGILEGTRLRSTFSIDLVFEDIHYYEKKSPGVSISLLPGHKGLHDGGDFHAHATAILAEFYGEKMVFLAEPCGIDSWGLIYEKLSNESEKVIKDSYNRNYNSSFNNDNNYFPFQVVILKPGDILYIPSGWHHKVYYLTPCIGTTQFIWDDSINVVD